MSKENNAELLETVVGAHIAQTVGFSEEHHGGLPDGAPKTSGVVRQIQALRCRFTPQDSSSRTLVRVPGSGDLRRVERADGWDAAAGDLRFKGYLVDLDVEQPHMS